METLTVRPLLKWVGGKRQLLPHLRRHYPAAFNAYVEPFLGSGAVFFDLYRAGRLRDRDVVLIDSNPDLIGCYESVRDDPDAIGRALDRLAAAHARGGHRHYYEVRDARFNPLREERRSSDGRIAYTPELAAMLIYLNRTGFNGLFRVNASGRFNVPAGRYERPRIVDRARLLQASQAFSSPRVRLEYGSFEKADGIARPGDFLYIDPPYAPVSRTANFTGYTSFSFDARHQLRLQQLVLSLARRGSHVLLSNSSAEEIVGLYDTNDQARRAGLRAFRVGARRSVNSNSSRRGVVDEYLITNVESLREAARH